MNTLPFDSHSGNVWEEKPLTKSAKCVCVSIRRGKKLSRNSPPLLITPLVFTLASQAEPPLLLQQTGRRSASGQCLAAPEGSCCQQATAIV